MKMIMIMIKIIVNFVLFVVLIKVLLFVEEGEGVFWLIELYCDFGK